MDVFSFGDQFLQFFLGILRSLLGNSDLLDIRLGIQPFRQLYCRRRNVYFIVIGCLKARLLVLFSLLLSLAHSAVFSLGKLRLRKFFVGC
jgi:hypothetical protein